MDGIAIGFAAVILSIGVLPLSLLFLYIKLRQEDGYADKDR